MLLAGILAVSSCAPIESRPPSCSKTSESAYAMNLPLAERGDPTATTAVVEYLSAEGPSSHLEYWRHRLEQLSLPLIDAQPSP